MESRYNKTPNKHLTNTEDESEDVIGDFTDDITGGGAGGKKTYADDVTMTEIEYQKLVSRYGEEKTKHLIEVLSNYKGSKGKKYISDYKAILSWVVKRVEEEKMSHFKQSKSDPTFKCNSIDYNEGMPKK